MSLDTDDGAAAIAIDLGNALTGTVNTGTDDDDNVLLPARHRQGWHRHRAWRR